MRKALFIALAVILTVFLAAYAFIYYVPYSEGVRSGELIKISRKGVVIKTWEGEISQGISGAQIFAFSVLDKDAEVIRKLEEYQGEYVKLYYVERFGLVQNPDQAAVSRGNPARRVLCGRFLSGQDFGYLPGFGFPGNQEYHPGRIVYHPSGEGKALLPGSRMTGDFANSIRIPQGHLVRENGGRMAVIPHPEQDQVETGQTVFPGQLPLQHFPIAPRFLRRRIFPPHAVDVVFGNG